MDRYRVFMATLDLDDIRTFLHVSELFTNMVVCMIRSVSDNLLKTGEQCVSRTHDGKDQCVMSLTVLQSYLNGHVYIENTGTAVGVP